MRRDLSSGWQSFEVIDKESRETPVSTALAQSDRLAQAHNKIQLVQDLGWPEARRGLKDGKGSPLVVQKDKVIWLLKCKPSCWRLYFCVFEKEKRIVYVYAVCKQKDKEDPADYKKARRLADNLFNGRSGITPFEFFDS